MAWAISRVALVWVGDMAGAAARPGNAGGQSMDVIILAFKLSVITRKMFNFSEMCLFEGHKSATTVGPGLFFPASGAVGFAWIHIGCVVY